MKEEKNPNKKGGGTLQQDFIRIMNEQGKSSDLWTVADMMEASGINKTKTDNAMANAWRTGKIDRHKDNIKTGSGWGVARYALKLKDSDKQVYVVNPIGGGTNPAKRRGANATPKEIRMAFMQVQNSLAKLEDMIMPIIEQAEDKDKILNKLKNML